MFAGNHAHSWWGLLGLIPIVSTFSERCLVWAAFGIDTTGCDQHEAK